MASTVKPIIIMNIIIIVIAMVKRKECLLMRNENVNRVHMPEAEGSTVQELCA
jgi:hypothetical protein